MKKLIFSIFCIVLFSFSNLDAQTFGCTNTSSCNLICNPLVEETGTGDCEEDVTIIYQEAFECVPGWRNLYGSIDHAEFDADLNNSFDYSGHPGNNEGSLMIAGFVSATSFITEGVGTPFDIDPNTDYLLTFSVADAVSPDGISNTTLAAEGIDVLLGNYSLLNTSGTSNSSLSYNYDFDVFLGSNGGSEFRNDATSIYQNENIDVSWTQKVSCFTTGSTSYDLLFFECIRPLVPPTFGGGVFYIKIDQIELIEDQFINNTAGISTDPTVQCGGELKVGAELCTVTGMEYQIWDVTDPTNELQLTNSTNTNAYNVSSIDGPVAILSDVLENVDLQIRRVFLPTDGVPVEDGNCNASLDISVSVVNCCEADPWPRIYEGPSYIAPTNLGIEFDGFGNVYVLRANNNTNSQYSNASMDLIKYCEDGELLWSTPLEQTILSGYRPNTRLAVDNSGQAYVLSMYQNSMSAGGQPINNPGHNIVILKFDSSGALINDRSISYPNNTLSSEYESIKVSKNGLKLYVLLNDRIKLMNPVTLGDIFDREGLFYSIDINAAGTDVFYLGKNQIGAFLGGLFNAPITATLVGVPHSKTDFEYDELHKRFYVVVKDFRLFVYRLNGNSINPLLTIPQCIKSSFYNEVHPVANGVLVYNPSTGNSKGYVGPEGVSFYNLGGVLQWNLPIQGYTTMRTPNMLNARGNFAYLGANWTKALNMGWYSSAGASGSFVSRINISTGTYSFAGDSPSEYTGGSSDNTNSPFLRNNFGNQSDQKLSVYPNPATHEITLDYQEYGDSEYSLAIYDTSGRVIFEEAGAKWTSRKTIQLSEANGLYLIRLSIDGKDHVEKFLIKN